MFTDVIEYSLAQGVTEEKLLHAAEDILALWMKKQDGFLGWEIGRREDGFVDFVHWEDKASMEKATIAMKDIPKDHPWLGCYDFSTIKARKVERVFSYMQ